MSDCHRNNALDDSIRPSEGGSAAVVAPARPRTSLTTLLTSHVLRDGEVVLLILKPSLWFIPLSAARSIAIVLILLIGARIYDADVPGSQRLYLELGVLLVGGRLIASTLQWMGRIYILTDLRVLRLGGVFTVDVFDCPLRKVARTYITTTTRERLVACGSIEIVSSDEELPIAKWETISRTVEVHEIVVSAINRAKQPGNGSR